MLDAIIGDTVDNNCECANIKTKNSPLRLDGKTEIVALPPRDFREAFRTDPQAFLLDVRTREEYDAGHLSGAALIDFLDEETFGREVPKLDHRPTYYIYCRSGRRSHLAAQRMLALGYRVVDMPGGILAWQEEGLDYDVMKK